MSSTPANKLKPAKKLTCDTPAPASNPAAVKKNILIVDDNPQIRQSLQKVLRAEGYEIMLAADGREGIEKFDMEQIDLLLLDVSLPDISGWDVYGAVTSLNPFVPIIIITGKNDQHELAGLSGVGALVEKPLNVPQLLQNIAEILAETPETHLKRLVGRHNKLRHVQPTLPGSQNMMSAVSRGMWSMKIKILVTNGDPHIRESLHKVLQAEGHDVVTADTGQEGVRIFYADHFDLLLLDVDLPDTSGWNIFKTLTSINPFLPVVITGRNDQHELVVFEGGALLAKLLDVPKIMQAMVGDARRIVGDASLMTNRPARRRGPYAASPVAMLRVT